MLRTELDWLSPAGRLAAVAGEAGYASIDSAPATAVRLLRDALRVLPERDDVVPYRGRLDEARALLSAQFPPPGQDARVLIPFLMGPAMVATVRASENRQLGVGTRVRLTPEDRAFLAGAQRHRSGGFHAGRS